MLWFKGNPTSAANSAPIYTIDARQRPLSSGAARHLVADAYKGRARFVVPAAQAGAKNHSAGQAPYLDLAPLEADDQGEYRCRIDYRARPRENFLMILFVLGEYYYTSWWRRPAASTRPRWHQDPRSHTSGEPQLTECTTKLCPPPPRLIRLFARALSRARATNLVPPSSVEMMDSNGRPLEQIYGPLSEGSDLTLLCLSKGGKSARRLAGRPLVRPWARPARVASGRGQTHSAGAELRQCHLATGARVAPLSAAFKQQLFHLNCHEQLGPGRGCCA